MDLEQVVREAVREVVEVREVDVGQRPGGRQITVRPDGSGTGQGRVQVGLLVCAGEGVPIGGNGIGIVLSSKILLGKFGPDSR